MMGMYAEDKSDETDKMRIRGSTSGVERPKRLMSGVGSADNNHQDNKKKTDNKGPWSKPQRWRMER